MYLARWRRNGKTHYTIRQSYEKDGCFQSRDLFYLGTDPGRHIVYVGGSGYYYAPELEDALHEAGVEADQGQLDHLLFEFLDPSIRRVIEGFDRGRRRSGPRVISAGSSASGAPHIFDKRRYHYLRFGHSDQRHIGRVPEKVFSPLQAKSRDELEQYFLAEERRLKSNEVPYYVSVVFELNRFTAETETDRPLIDQMDDFFITRLCRLNEDKDFRGCAAASDGLHPYLTRYAVMYFDYEPPRRSPWQAYVEDFIRRHRVYHPPRSETIKLEEAGRLFGLPWKELEKLDRKSLSRLYRRLALKHHPDQGGEPELFRRLSKYYRVLVRRGRR